MSKTAAATNTKTAVITGAAQGLGLATAMKLAEQGYTVCLLGRNIEKIKAAASELKSKGFDARAYVVDVSKSIETQSFATRLREEFPNGIHVLINNAGRLPDEADVFQATEQQMLETFNNNTLSATRMIKALAPLLRQSGDAVIVNVSSGLGQLSDMNSGYISYRLSKVALNAVTRIFAEEFKDDGIRVNSVCPGWVRTAMGGSGAERSIEEGIAGIVWAATLPKDGPTGGFFRDGEKLDW